MAELILIDNPFEVYKRKRIKVPACVPLRELLPKDYKNGQLRLIYQGKRIDTSDPLSISLASEEDQLVVLKLPGTGVEIVTILGVTITVGKVLTALALTGLSVGIQFAVSALSGRPKNRKFFDNEEGSPTYSWDGIQNTTANGTPIQLVYGKHKVGGQIISAFTEVEDNNKHYLYLLIALSGGEIEAINGITADSDNLTGSSVGDGLKFDNNPAEDYSNFRAFYRLGSWQQSVIKGFRDVRSQTSLNAALEYNEPYTFSCDRDVNAVQFQIKFPNGLYARDSKGALRQFDVSFLVEYKRPGETAWTEYGTFTASAKNTSQYVFSAKIYDLEPAEYQVRITRQTINDADQDVSTGVFYVSSSYLIAVTQIAYDDIAYKGIALLGIKALATEQLSGRAPNVTSILHGRKIKRYKPGDLFGPDTEQDFSSRSDGAALWGWYVENMWNCTTAKTHTVEPYSLVIINADNTATYTPGLRDAPFIYKRIYGNFSLVTKVKWKEGYSSPGCGFALLIRRRDMHHEFRAIGAENVGGTVKWRFAHGSSETTYDCDATDETFYLKITKDDSNIRFYTSPDGENWTERGDPAYPGLVLDYAEIGIISYKSDASAQQSIAVQQFSFEDTTSYSIECCNNPAWVVYDLFSDSDYCAGSYVGESKLDLDSFISFAEYCDEQVSDGRGGYHARHRCDIVIDAARSIWEQALLILENYNAVLIKTGDKIRIAWLHAQDPVQLFSMANIKKGSFSVTYSAKEVGANCWQMQFLNAERDFEQDYAVYQDPEIESGEPLRGRTVSLYGITRPEEAYRAALFKCKQNRYQRKAISFECGIEAIACEPYDVISVQHDVPQWGIAAGRVVSSTSNSITLDKPVDLDSSYQYEIKIRHADDSITTTTLPLQSGKLSTLVVNGWTKQPLPDEIYVVGRQEVSTNEFVVTRIERVTDFECKIEAVEYNSAIYDPSVEFVPEADRSDLPDPRRLPDNVQEVILTERAQVHKDGTVIPLIDVAWPASTGADHYEIWYREVNRIVWLYAGQTSSLHFVIGNVISDGLHYDRVDPIIEGNEYEVAVVSVSAYNAKRLPDDSPQQRIRITGRVTPPSDIDADSIQISRIGDLLIVRWDAVEDRDLYGYEVRYSDTTEWNTAKQLGTIVPSPELITADFATGTWYFMIKAINNSGIYSTNAAIKQATVPESDSETSDWSRDERSLGWPGTLSGFVENDSGELELRSGFVTGLYTTPIIDSGTVHAQKIRALATVTQVVSELTWDSADFTWDSIEAETTPWEPNDDFVVADHGIIFKYADTESELNAKAWEPFQAGEYSARYFQFGVVVSVTYAAYGAKVTQFVMEATI